jgi:hypothetical protein
MADDKLEEWAFRTEKTFGVFRIRRCLDKGGLCYAIAKACRSGDAEFHGDLEFLSAVIIPGGWQCNE